MSSLIIPLYKLFDKINLIISGYFFIDLVNLYNGVEVYADNSILKKIAVLLPIIWYIYLFTNKFLNKRLDKENKTLENENIKLENEILKRKKEILEQPTQEEIKELIKELEEKERELKENS